MVSVCGAPLRRVCRRPRICSLQSDRRRRALQHDAEDRWDRVGHGFQDIRGTEHFLENFIRSVRHRHHGINDWQWLGGQGMMGDSLLHTHARVHTPIRGANPRHNSLLRMVMTMPLPIHTHANVHSRTTHTHTNSLTHSYPHLCIVHTGAQAIVAGNKYSLVLKTDGTVWSTEYKTEPDPTSDTFVQKLSGQ